MHARHPRPTHSTHARRGTSRRCGASRPRSQDPTAAAVNKRALEATLLLAAVSTGDVVWLPRGWNPCMVGACGCTDTTAAAAERPHIAWWPCLQAETFEENADHAPSMHVLAFVTQPSVRAQWPEDLPFKKLHGDVVLPPTNMSAASG